MNLIDLYKIFKNSTGISTDTRSIEKGNLYISLSGENFNGNKFAKKAIEKGASFAIIDDQKYAANKTIKVKNTLNTLQKLANHHRKELNTTIIALTGSNGKTTTKELINSVISTKFNTTATEGNLNNHIGVPLTLLSMTKDTEIGIVEMGANNFNEIKLLAEIAEPNYGYITNFGKAHLEGFKSLEGVIKAKSELYEYLRKNQKSAFINLDNKTQLKQSKDINSITFSEKMKTDSNIIYEKGNKYATVEYETKQIKSNLIGNYNFTNIAAAICIGKHFKISKTDIKNAIENYNPTNNRSQVISKNTNNIILDAYNANPTSMKAALESFDSIQNTKKTVFIGDMFELGETSNQEHQEIVNYIESLNIDSINIIGENFKKTQHKNTIKSFKNYEELSEQFKTKPKNHTILIKGSRGMALERILDLL
ncbi:UDP-N-acetylmuramoyl-tripeptide--D-alanyl-D-alanine ligase [Flavobacteriaceae bacterium]|nr:UDP-N-acetylmuramoyl-tripeptide--D-alanyl-D-alanine ligase [Flavobacteriaceae bacterium]